ncbi:MAG: hypothetical protein LBU34_18095 [Planctomycetaceae bacterium]|nr:hypothetical protein [Planctomycetaceae bacterium]
MCPQITQILRLTIHKVGGVSPKRRLPIGNQNNQYYINLLSANADATATASGCLPCEWGGGRRSGGYASLHRRLCTSHP